MSAQDTTWIIASPEGNKGPFDRAQMVALLTSGKITADNWIWRQGMANWTQLGPSGDFNDVLKTAPPAAQAAAGGAGLPSKDDALDALFIAQVKKSWKQLNKKLVASQMDEVVIGGVITGVLDAGYSLIDLGSDGSNHHLRFEDIQTGNRVIFQLRAGGFGALLGQLGATAAIHEAHVTVGYGERVRDFNKIMGALRQEMKGGFIHEPDPGVLTIDGDISSQYVYVQVNLIWDLKDYLDPQDPYRVVYPKLSQDLSACIHALRKYLRGRFA
jgi:hypothetical protein